MHFLIVLVILYIWLPEDQNQSVRAVANAQRLLSTISYFESVA